MRIFICFFCFYQENKKTDVHEQSAVTVKMLHNGACSNGLLPDVDARGMWCVYIWPWAIVLILNQCKWTITVIVLSSSQMS